MKTCPNCSTIHADDFGGQCFECGRPMGEVNANGGGDLTFRYANQLGRARREAQSESSLRRGDYSALRAEDGVMDISRAAAAALERAAGRNLDA